jgi:hypothetical protein
MLSFSQRALDYLIAKRRLPTRRIGGRGHFFSGRFDGCSFPTFVHFGAPDCKDGLGGNAFI